MNIMHNMNNSFKMKKNIAIILLLLFTFSVPFESKAQAPDPNDFFDDDPNPNDAPIDENLLALMGAGLFLGLYLIKANNKKYATQ